MSKSVIRKDDKGLYVKHGDDIVRPIASAPLSHEGYLEGQNHGKSIIRAKNFTVFKEGDHVDKYHISQTIRIRLRNEVANEMWYVQYRE